MIRKIGLVSKFMKAQPVSQTVAIYISINISRSKRNQTMKFDQLIEYNIRNIYLRKPYKACGGEAIARPFSKKSKLNISLD